MSEKGIISLFVGLVLCGGVRADLLVETTFDFQNRPLVSAPSDLESRITDVSGPVHTLNFREWAPLRLLPEPRYNLDKPTPVLPVLGSSDSGQSSLSLCLSALVSLGLRQCMPSIIRTCSSFNCIFLPLYSRALALKLKTGISVSLPAISFVRS